MKKTFNEAFSYAARLCSASEYCRVDVEEKLKRFNLNPGELNRLIENLEKERYLDERRYARAYVHDKFSLNKWGKLKIKTFLKQKKIANDIIEEALSGLNEAQYTKTLIDLLKRKDRMMNNLGVEERRIKLFRYVLGRGFELPLVNACLRNYLKDSDDCLYEFNDSTEP